MENKNKSKNSGESKAKREDRKSYLVEQRHSDSEDNLSTDDSNPPKNGDIPKEYSNKEESRQVNKSSKIDVNAENKLLNNTLDFLSLLSFVGFLIMSYDYSGFWDARKDIIPSNYKVPGISDLIFLCIPGSIIVILKMSIEKYGQKFMNSILSPKYKTGTDENSKVAELILTKKMCTSLFKLIYYIIIVLLGQIVVRNLDFFPKELFGTGEIMNLFKPCPEKKLAPGIPCHQFFDKPAFFDVYYLSSLAFVMIDMFWLMFIYERQSDFQLMRLHHICTISLVLFSYLTNGGHLGIIIFYLHDLTDIIVYLTRICINTALRDSIKYSVCAVLLVSFLYFRLYIFGNIIHVTYYYLQIWHIFNIFMFSFTCILFVMHLYWIYSIVKRFFYKKIEDVGQVKKLNKSKEI